MKYRRFLWSLFGCIVAVAAAAIWSAYSQAAEVLRDAEGRLLTITDRVLRSEGNSEEREAARDDLNALRKRLDDLEGRLFVQEKSVATLLRRIDYLERRLRYAEELAEYQACRADVARTEAEAEKLIAECEGRIANHAECQAESTREAAQATLGGCVLAGAAVAIITGGLGAGAVGACAVGGAAGYAAGGDDCGERPACSRDRQAAVKIVLGRQRRAELPVCRAPEPPPAFQA